MNAAAYPEDLKYHPEHDWARVEGDEAVFGITWYAQDALGEVVFYEPPAVGSTVDKDKLNAEWIFTVRTISLKILVFNVKIMNLNYHYP